MYTLHLARCQVKITGKINTFPWVKIINKYRLDKESNRSFCSRMGLNHHIFASWGNGEKPSIKSLNKIKDNLQLSYEDYTELMMVCHEIEPKESTFRYAHVSENTLEPTNLPYSYFCKRLFYLKDKRVPLSVFLNRMGITPEEWVEWMQDPQPNVKLDRLWDIFTRLGYEKRSQLIKWLLTDDLPLEEVSNEIKKSKLMRKLNSV